MNLDNINDIETLKNLLKKYMVKVKKDFKADFCVVGHSLLNGNDFVFKKDHYYDITQGEFSISVHAGNYIKTFRYKEADEYLYSFRG